ncbi:hypothetical protein MSG28_014467 [Choristoneura fumiferana]|uniref:Uncharacterized protein n=1 Tax=Choristoneura fumiferana TaxID=7141 RepID=A0ACC0JRY6_CHOFU|nr:hypothetical protein MSG28_014467 [Choristoneura fumiferana]
MAMKTLTHGQHRLTRLPHSVRFSGDDSNKYKALDSSDSSPPIFGPSSYTNPNHDSGAPRIKLLTQINQIVQQRADLEANRLTLSNLLEELRRKLKRRTEECHLEKKDRMKADSKLAAARLMRDIAELRQRVAQRKRQAEMDIARLRKELSYNKSCIASLRLAPPPLRKQCSKFA